jgi:hypothetical protein
MAAGDTRCKTSDGDERLQALAGEKPGDEEVRYVICSLFKDWLLAATHNRGDPSSISLEHDGIKIP